MVPQVNCPDCEALESPSLSRRQFVRTAGAATAAVSLANLWPAVARAEESAPQPESLVKKLYDSLSDSQKSSICFPWDYKDDANNRGLLRTHVSNNWNITDIKKFTVGSDFFTKDQRDLIEHIFYGLYNPDWRDRIKQQLQDDAGGYGKAQTIAIFGQPGTDKFEFVMTGRHLTIRCDGNTTDHVAFGGPIFYGHAAKGFDEAADHPGNVFWPQAIKANNLYKMLDGKQRERALISDAPSESSVPFQGPGKKYPGLPIAELSADQKQHAQQVLQTLLEPYRTSDRQEALVCLEKFGGLDACSISFYKTDDIGNDQTWDIWRIEGPAFIWHYRGAPHVHVWANVADDPGVELNAIG